MTCGSCSSSVTAGGRGSALVRRRRARTGRPRARPVRSTASRCDDPARSRRGSGVLGDGDELADRARARSAARTPHRSWRAPRTPALPRATYRSTTRSDRRVRSRCRAARSRCNWRSWSTSPNVIASSSRVAATTSGATRAAFAEHLADQQHVRSIRTPVSGFAYRQVLLITSLCHEDQRPAHHAVPGAGPAGHAATSGDLPSAARRTMRTRPSSRCTTRRAPRCRRSR